MFVSLLHYIAHTYICAERGVNKSIMENGRSERIVSIKVLPSLGAVLARWMLSQVFLYVLNRMLPVPGKQDDALRIPWKHLWARNKITRFSQHKPRAQKKMADYVLFVAERSYERSKKSL